MNPEIRRLAKEFLEQASQPQGLGLEAWCAQQKVAVDVLREAARELGFREQTLDLQAPDSESESSGTRAAKTAPGATKPGTTRVDPGAQATPGNPTAAANTEPGFTHSAADGGAIDRTESLDSPSEAQLFDGRYRILDTLGEGGFGKVYLVEDTYQSDEKLALKLIKAEHQNTDAFAKRFQLEIRVLRALRHEGIPPIYNDGITPGGEVYFTMAYVPGRSLQEILRSGRQLTPLEIASYVRQMVDILDYAHGQGIVHRDLKPGNVLVQNDGTDDARVQILDFGIAKVLKKEGALESAVTMQTAMPIGTPHYMAPEQVRGQTVDGKTDLYALGVMIYRMVSGGYPFKGDTSMAVMAARLQEKPTPLPETSQPGWAAALVRDLLATEREQRPSTGEVQALIDSGVVLQRTVRTTQWMVGALLLAGVAWAALALFNRSEEAGPSGDGQSHSADLQDDTLQPNERPSTAALPSATHPGADAQPNPVHDDSAQPEPIKPKPAKTDPDQTEPKSPAESSSEPTSTAQDSSGIPIDSPGTDTLSPRIEWSGLALQADGSPAAIHTQATKIVWKGRVSDDRSVAALVCNGVEVAFKAPEAASKGEPGEGGSFEFDMALPDEGLQIARWRAVDSAGNATTTEVVVHVDRTPPKITFDELLPAAVIDPAYRLSGQVHDGRIPQVRLQLDGEELELAATGRFQVELPLVAGRNEFMLTAEDGVGLRSERKLVIQREQPAATAPKGCAPVAGSQVIDGRAAYVEHTRSGIRMRLVPQSPDAQAAPFYIGETEVTRGQYAKLGELPSAGPDATARHPVAEISFEAAQAWCARAELRLLSESEWIQAAGSQAYPWGAEWQPTFCNGNFAGGDRFASASPVGLPAQDKTPSGLLGMAGNVSEWVVGPTGKRLMGGSFRDRRAEWFITNKPRKLGRLPDAKDSIGFRVGLAAE